MILKAISHLLLQKSHLKTGSARIISCEFRGNLTWQTFSATFLANKRSKSPHLPQNNLIQPLWSINHFWLVRYQTRAGTRPTCPTQGFILTGGGPAWLPSSSIISFRNGVCCSSGRRKQMSHLKSTCTQLLDDLTFPNSNFQLAFLLELLRKVPKLLNSCPQGFCLPIASDNIRDIEK